jgi:hypothetical protein
MRLALLTLALMPFLSLTPAARAADSYAYLAAGNGTFGVLDLTSGAFTPCLSSGGTTFAGLAKGPDGTLYGGYVYTGTFGHIDPVTGKFKVIGTSNILFESMGSLWGTIYALDGNFKLYSINPTTAAATLIGSTGLALGQDNWFGMSAGATDKLYFYLNNELYALNVLTGHARRISKISPNLGPMTKVDGVLYVGVQSTPLAIDSVNPKTGALTPVSTVSNEPYYFWGMARASGPGCSH